MTIAGTAAGTVLAIVIQPILRALLPGSVPQVGELQVNISIIEFAAVMSAVTTILAAIAPAWGGTRENAARVTHPSRSWRDGEPVGREMAPRARRHTGGAHDDAVDLLGPSAHESLAPRPGAAGIRPARRARGQRPTPRREVSRVGRDHDVPGRSATASARNSRRHHSGFDVGDSISWFRFAGASAGAGERSTDASADSLRGQRILCDVARAGRAWTSVERWRSLDVAKRSPSSRTPSRARHSALSIPSEKCSRLAARR